MSVRKKLTVIFLSIIAMLWIMCVMNYNNLIKIENSQEVLIQEKILKLNDVHNLRYSITCQGLYMREFLINNDKDLEIDQLNSCSDEVNKMIVGLQENKNIDQDKLRTIDESNQTFNKAKDKFVALVQEGNIDHAYTMLEFEMKDSNNKMMEMTGHILEETETQIKDISIQSNKAIEISKWTSFLVVVVIVMITILVMFLIKHSIIKPLVLLYERSILLAKGDLTGEPIPVKSRDEIGKLSKMFNEMQDNNKRLVNNIKGNAEHLNNLSEELTSSLVEIITNSNNVNEQMTNTELSVKTASSTASASESAMFETAHGVSRIAENTQVLTGTSLDTTDAAEEGTKTINQAQDQMEMISKVTEDVRGLVSKLETRTMEINSITMAIAGITDQTNLLALNASIEAARAGEHGKGFAVVADEVKKLAEQSKESAVLISKLTHEIKSDTTDVLGAVDDAIDSVKSGVKIIDEAKESFNSIKLSVQKMQEQITDISATTEELAAGTEEVSASVSEINSGTEKVKDNVHNVITEIESQLETIKQVSQVSHLLFTSSVNLKQEIDRFKI